MIDALEETLASARQDFAVETFPEGGVLLHLPSGEFFQLEARAAAVWSAVRGEASAEATVAQTAAALRLSAAEARGVLDSVLAQARSLHVGRPVIPPAFWDDEQILSLRDGPRTLMSLDKRASTLTVADGLREGSDQELAAALRVFVPKIFGQWFPLAMHASAVNVGDRTIMFCGESGAGKTTTAHMLAEELTGSQLLSEDMVAFRDEIGTLMMVDGVEAVVRAWMSDATAALVERRESRCDVAGLRVALEGETARRPIHKAIFLRAERRRGPVWSFEPVSPAVAIGRLLLYSFLPSPGTIALRSHLRACHTLAGQIHAADAAAVPDGLAALRRASRAQSLTIAS